MKISAYNPNLSSHKPLFYLAIILGTLTATWTVLNLEILPDADEPLYFARTIATGSVVFSCNYFYSVLFHQVLKIWDKFRSK